MKKLTKTVISFALVVVMLVCFCGTAFAASTSWGGSFPTIQQGSQSDYNFGLQSYLYRYNPATRSQLTQAGGIDGSFGPGTTTAVEIFQSMERLEDVDGIVGEDTWDAMYLKLGRKSYTAAYTYYLVANLDPEDNLPYYIENAISRRYEAIATGVFMQGWYAYMANGSPRKFSDL